MTKIGATGSRFQETLKRASTLPTDPPPDPTRGMLHQEKERWWRFSDSWMPIEPTSEERNEYALQVAVTRTEDMEKIADALKQGMLGEFQKAANLLVNPPALQDPPGGTYSAGGWYETGGNVSMPRSTTPHHPVTLNVRSDLMQNRYFIDLEINRPTLEQNFMRARGYLNEEELDRRAESVAVYGAWMRTVGYELARYTWYQWAEHKEGRDIVLAAYSALLERGVVMERHDWMDNPELKNDVARAIASIKKVES